MAAFLDICRFNPTAGGTTDWTVSAAVSGYLVPATAGAVNGRLYKYRAESADLSQWEIGEGAYNTATGILARTTVLFNSAGTTAKINFSAAPQVAVVALKEDLLSIEEANGFTAAQQAQARTNIDAAGHGQCLLALTGGNLVLTPKNGNQLKVNGASCTVPDAGVSLAATGLTPLSLFYIYAVATAGAVTSLEASATAYAVSATAGNKGVVIKSGDDTRTLVGMARVVAGPAWVDTQAQRHVRSWFNDPGIYSFNNFTATRQTASATYVEVNTEIRIEACIWAGETWDVAQFVAGFFNGTSNSNNFSAIAFNGITPEKNGVLTTLIGAIGGTAFGAGARSPKSGLAEGFNFATLIGKCDLGTATWSSSADGNRTVMTGYARR